MSLNNLAIKIGRMRYEVRRGHIDVRANTRVMKDFHAWLIKNAPKKRQPGEEVAAEDYEGDDVDMREKRALKRSRQQEEEDPSYLGDRLERGAGDAAPTTRAKVQKSEPKKVEPAARPCIAVASTSVARPPPSPMDALPTPVSGNFAQPNPTVNPYTQVYAAGSTQRLNLNQAQQAVSDPII